MLRTTTTTGVLLFFVSAGLARSQQDLGSITRAESLHIAAIGDFGTGSPQQKAIAQAIHRRHVALPFDFGITLGDNFYRCGVKGVEDPKWTRFWEEPYGKLGIPFYAALGNHDYGHPPVICPGLAGSPDAEVAYTKVSKSWRMPARYYTYRAGPALFIVLDTEGWSEEQFQWMKRTLEASAADAGIRWRIVYGHHPMYTSGVHLNERRIGVLRERLMPVFQATKVDLYICGHDHDLEHLRKGGVEFIICGGGGAKLRKQRRRDPASVFAVAKNAFLDLRIDADRLTASFVDADLRILEDPPLTIERQRQR